MNYFVLFVDVRGNQIIIFDSHPYVIISYAKKGFDEKSVKFNIKIISLQELFSD